jgi:hypothetical protein
LKNDVNVPSKSNKQKKHFLSASRYQLTKRAGSGSHGSGTLLIKLCLMKTPYYFKLCTVSAFKSELIKSSVRMVPLGLDPVCQKLKMVVSEFKVGVINFPKMRCYD